MDESGVDVGRNQGWCPECGLRSVERFNGSLICNSPQCGWEARRTLELELEVFGEPMELSETRLNRLREMYDLAPAERELVDVI